MSPQIPDAARWFAVRLARRMTPARAARRLGVTVDQLARICAGFPVRARVVRTVAGAFAVYSQ
jgi:hypothetical protein